jgi:hypothetical protein
MDLGMEAPLILLAPDSAASTTFFSFYSEKARLASNISFFSFSLSAAVLMEPSNFLKTPPSRSVAASGGFYFSSFFFLFLSSFPPFFVYFYYFTSGFYAGGLFIWVLFGGGGMSFFYSGFAVGMGILESILLEVLLLNEAL